MAAKGSKSYWIGLNRESTKKGWNWQDNSAVVFLNWDSSYKSDTENDERCALLDVASDSKWKSSLCISDVRSVRNNYICEKLKNDLPITTTPVMTTPQGMNYGCPLGWENNLGNCYQLFDSTT